MMAAKKKEVSFKAPHHLQMPRASIFLSKEKAASLKNSN